MYVFGSCELDPARFELRRGGTVVHLQPQVFSVLRYLLEHRHRVVLKAELPGAVWGGRFVSDSTLSSRIKAARQAVGDDGAAQQLIATVHGVGCRFVGDAAGPPPDGALEEAHRIAEHRQEEQVHRCRVHHNDQCGHPCPLCALGHQKADRIRGV
jgi:DNA-binding winged helix-turn-helix (wHTH) protein